METNRNYQWKLLIEMINGNCQMKLWIANIDWTMQPIETIYTELLMADQDETR